MGARCWIAVASAEHVAVGRSLGFMQVCHGKATPLRRLAPGDCVIYYSPVSHFGGKDRLQAFTAIGAVVDRKPYQVEMAAGFEPWRRDVRWRDAHEAPIRPLVGKLAFTRDSSNWGFRFRFGLFEIVAEDAALIAMAMKAAGEDAASLEHGAAKRRQDELSLQSSSRFE